VNIGDAIDYLTPKIPHRPLWSGKESVSESLYVAPCSTRKDFTSSLRNQYKVYLVENNLAIYSDGKIHLPKKSDGKRDYIDYSEEFLNTVVARYNRRDIPSGYALAEHIDHNLPRKIDLELQFETIGVDVLDEGGRERVAYPEVFLRILSKTLQETYQPEQAFNKDDRNERYQSVIKSSLAAYHEYLTNLCAVPLVLAPSISCGKAKIFSEVTNNCMKTHSLKLQIENWGEFLAAQNATPQARQ